MTLFDALTPRQREIAALADELATRFAARADAHDRAGTFPFENYADLHESGYLRLVIPAAYGGAEARLAEMVVAQERLARGDSGTALAVSMLTLLLGGQRDQPTWPESVFATICRVIAAEGGLINSVVTEPELGSISRGGVPATTATPTGGGWLVNGRKIFATGAPALRYFVTGVVLPPGEHAPQGEMASAIIEAGAPGLRIERTWGQGLAMRTSGSDDVIFEDVFVPEGWLVGRRAIGAPAGGGAAPGTSGWSLTVAAVYLGIGQAACDAACDYANTRTPPSLGAPIATLPHIQQWIGEMQIALDAARAVLHDAARLWDERPDLRPRLGPRIAAAKYLATNGACQATELALRVAGGFSLTRDLPLERFFRDARAGLFNPPQDDLALAMVGRAALAGRAPGAAAG
jgi:alkylation response protein AidB-like acyl-CoA dehydrogenase